MDARYAFRKRQLLEECQVAPEIFEQVIPRLYTFMEPFVKTFQGQAAAQHARTYVCGLLSDVKRKNIESIAYRLASRAYPCKASLGGMSGTMNPCDMSCSSKSRRTWDKAMVCWYLIPGVCQVWSGVGGGGPAVVWPSGQSR